MILREVKLKSTKKLAKDFINGYVLNSAKYHVKDGS